MSPLAWAAFVVAGAVGASLRYLIDIAITERATGTFPWATFVINVTGSFLLGLLIGLGLHHGLPKPARLILGVAFCGAYTTFSTFSFETVRLLEAGDPVAAFKNAVATVLVGLAAGAAGLAVVAAGA
ncbi:MAG TPA: fluoride efflux transporter CrcB [Acidimicrobiia bacterium]|nr:fluoride efflux transporter CrcB [Acidimicrobiia bacterium]